MHKRIKNIKTKFHFIRDETEDGTNSIHYVPSDKMAADIFTKSIPVSRGGNIQNCFDLTQSTQIWVELLEYRSIFSFEHSEYQRKFISPEYQDKRKLISIT